MIPIAVIHNSERKERLQTLLNEIEEQEINIVILFDAIKNELIQTGISQAHKSAVKYAKENGLKEIMICEDDVKFSDKGAFKHYVDNKPEIYDIYFGAISGGDVDEINKTVVGFSGMICYMVHERFYDTFLQADEGSHLDRWLSGFNHATFKKHSKKVREILGRQPVYKICYPMIATTYNGYSDNFGRYMNYDQFFYPYKLYKNDKAANNI